jgi:hypothetical protein
LKLVLLLARLQQSNLESRYEFLSPFTERAFCA